MTSPALVDQVRRQLLAYIISRQITCPITGQVLDVRTAVPLLDSDGDPARALSPAGADALRKAPERLEQLRTAHGLTLPD